MVIWIYGPESPDILNTGRRARDGLLGAENVLVTIDVDQHPVYESVWDPKGNGKAKGKTKGSVPEKTAFVKNTRKKWLPAKQFSELVEDSEEDKE